MDCNMQGFPVHHQLLELTQNSCPLSWWCHPTISSFVVPFSFCLQSFPATGTFPVSQFFESGGQSIGASVLASVLRMNIQDWFFFRMDWLDLLEVQGTLKSLLQHHSWKHSPKPQSRHWEFAIDTTLSPTDSCCLRHWTFLGTLTLTTPPWPWLVLVSGCFWPPRPSILLFSPSRTGPPDHLLLLRTWQTHT